MASQGSPPPPPDVPHRLRRPSVEPERGPQATETFWSETRLEALMATEKQVKTARRNVKKAQQGARSQRSIAHLPKATRSALGKQGAAVAQRKRTGSDSPK